MSIYQQFTPSSQYLTLMLRGAPGSGKTTKAVQFPKPALFSFDSNLASLRRLPTGTTKDLKIINPSLRFVPAKKEYERLKPEKIWDNFIEQLREVLADKTVKTVIIDSLTTLSEVVMDKILKTGSPETAPEIQHWGAFTRYMKFLGTEMLCAADLDKHLIFTAHEEVVTDAKTLITKYNLVMSTKMRDSFPLFFSDVWRTHVKASKTKEAEYWVRTAPTPQHSLKCSLDLPEDFLWDESKDKVLSQVA